MASRNAASNPPETKRRRLPRAAQACEMCRARKTRCNQQMPCSNCSCLALVCSYGASGRAERHCPKRSSSQASTDVRTQPDQTPAAPVDRRLTRRSRSATSDLPADHPVGHPVGHPVDDPIDPMDPVQDNTPPPLYDQPLDDPLDSDNETIATLGDLNTHTQGTEFYGGSSNHAFLHMLYARARTRAHTWPPCDGTASPPGRGHGTRPDIAAPGHLRNSRLSIVNLLYNADHVHDAHDAHDALAAAVCVVPDADPRLALREQYFADSYFANKHYIHPFLDPPTFRARCTHLWGATDASSQPRTPFHALYYAVLAVGAINAPISDSPLLATAAGDTPLTTLQWANGYFDRAHRALGNAFETSSLDTCQALFLLTVFCQNALKPHSSYLLSGMAVRTAIAIGLANDTYGQSAAAKQEARRTWWCIYSHEVEMCCSSGRVDGLKDPRHYLAPLPQGTTNAALPGATKQYAIIAVMVDLARIVQAASQDIYHVAQRSLQRKSHISFQLDAALDNWIKQLPPFLNFESFALDDAEWTYKQKLVLKFRSYNARILIHRPFLIASSASYDSSEFLRHVDLCLDASRKTIRVIHESLAHRPYLRTWWYCTTYALYASMIILHLVLLDFPRVPGEELIEDIERSLDIFAVMGKHVTVARRCGELTQEILGVAKTYLHDRRTGLTGTHTPLPALLPTVDTELFGSMLAGNDMWDDEQLIALLNQNESGLSRANALANFLDPTVLEGFFIGE